MSKNFQVENIEAFKAAYCEAQEAGQESFRFNGEEVLCTYAKQLIIYVEKGILVLSEGCKTIEANCRGRRNC